MCDLSNTPLIEAKKQWEEDFADLKAWLTEQFAYGQSLRDECDRLSAQGDAIVAGWAR
jgi:hypothetical protein